MKPSAKITVPDVIEQFYNFYKDNNYSWGVFSLVLLKANYNNYCVNYCLEKATQPEEIKLGKTLLSLTPTQRIKISRICVEKESKEKELKS